MTLNHTVFKLRLSICHTPFRIKTYASESISDSYVPPLWLLKQPRGVKK